MSEHFEAAITLLRVADAPLTANILLRELRAAGFEKLICSYDGYGDSGDTWLELQRGTELFGPQAVGLTDNDAKALLEMLEPHLPGGWEINEGSSGTATLDLLKPNSRPVIAHREKEYDSYDDGACDDES